VVVGRALLKSTTATARLSLQARSVATLVDDPDLGAARDWDGAIAGSTTRYYAGDLHVHSRDSGDARASLEEIETLALSKGLDFVVITDHNTDAHVPHLARKQDSSPLLWVPGMEFTTYNGHVGAVGATTAVDQKLGLSTNLDAALSSLRDQGAVVVMNHPVLDLGDVCIGCPWQHDTQTVDAVEVATGGYRESGFLFQANAISTWEGIVAAGIHAAPVGGSDDHRAGIDLGAFQSPIGNPTTHIEADELSVPALLAGIKASRTVVQMQGAGDPMITTATTPPRVGDTVVGKAGEGVSFTWDVSDVVAGDVFRVLVDGVVTERVVLELGATTITRRFEVPTEGETRVRSEIQRGDAIAVLTGYAWLVPAPPGCGGCASSQLPSLLASLTLLATARRARRRRANH
jgi:hypothetical protein